MIGRKRILIDLTENLKSVGARMDLVLVRCATDANVAQVDGSGDFTVDDGEGCATLRMALNLSVPGVVVRGSYFDAIES
jgi:hypothetical protein